MENFKYNNTSFIMPTVHLTHSGHLGLSVLLVEIHCLRNKL